MNYYINPTALLSAFPVPCEVADRHLRLASGTQLKVLLYVLRNLSGKKTENEVAAALGIPAAEAADALLYWTQAGVFKSDSGAAETTASAVLPPERVVAKTARPSRSDVAQRGAEDAKIRFLLREAQQKFGRNLKSNEASTLVWLYDDEGMDVSVILILVQYAVSEGRCNIGFIEKTAVQWIENGVQNVPQAEEQIAGAIRKKSAWSVVESAFGIEKRLPSTRELELSDLWINQWKLPQELLKCAYDACIDAKAKLSVPYVAKIIENWHKKGYRTAAEVGSAEQSRKAAEQSNGATYDLDLFEQMLNSDD